MELSLAAPRPPRSPPPPPAADTPAPASSVAPVRDRRSELVRATLAFAQPSRSRSLWALVSTVVAFAGTLIVIRALGFSWGLPCAGVLLGGLLIRVFVLQHDCGHRSLFRSRRANDVVGRGLSFLTGVPYDPWRVEHDWHHRNQGKLERRGIDRVNSPPTVDEAHDAPREAATRARLVSWPMVVLLGIWSLHIKRKRLRGFFFLRPGFPGRVLEEATVRRGFALTLLGASLFHLAGALWMGPALWFTAYLGSMALGSVAAATLFWVQHNFERTYHASAPDWHHADVALRGSSYLRLGPLASWLTGDIGLHHVHHLNARIPSYRLEEARRSLPALAAIAPLTFREVRESFHKLFWDPSRRIMVDYASLGLRGAAPHTQTRAEGADGDRVL